MSTEVEIREAIAAKSKALAEIFEQSGESLDLSKAEALKGFPDGAARAAEVRRRNDELTDLGKQRDELKALAEVRDHARAEAEKSGVPSPIRFPGGGGSGAPESKKALSPGAAFVSSAEYKAAREQRGSRHTAAVEIPEAPSFKATFDTPTSALTSYDRQAFVFQGVQRLSVADLLAQGTTTAPTIRYPQETSFTNAATTVSEGALKPEATWATAEVNAPVRKIAVTAKVTDELFSDFAAMQTYIDNRMRYMVGLTEEAQLLNGNGTAPNIRGIMATSGIQTQAKGTDPTPDAIYKAMILILSVGFFSPDGVVVHPLDWQDIKLLRTADGIYIWGSPTDVGPDRIWGLPVAITTSQPQNTALVGAFKLGAQVFYRQGLMVESTNSNEDDFKRNLIAIRAEQREALAVYRPKAFCTVTGV